MGNHTSKSTGPGQAHDGPFQSVNEALASISPNEWRRLSTLGEHLLTRLRRKPQMARYLAGMSGREIVGSAVLALHLGEIAPGGGRKAKPHHLANTRAFSKYVEQVVRSLADNFRRHPIAQIPHTPIDQHGPAAVDPASRADLSRHLVLRDVLRVLLPRLFQEVKNKPAQLAVVKACVESLGNDAILPCAGQSKFVVHRVRLILRKHLQQLARELGVENPTGKEMFL